MIDPRSLDPNEGVVLRISLFLLDYSICVLVDAFIRFMTCLFHVTLLHSFYIALSSIALRRCLAQYLLFSDDRFSIKGVVK